MSLIPEKPLLVSPSLAATIGLEEAVLLQALGELMAHYQAETRNGFDWLEVDADKLEQLLPFWSDHDIQRIANNLRDKGVLLIGSAPYGSSRILRFAFNQRSQAATTTTKAVELAAPASNLIGHTWQPDQELLRQLAQYNIPGHFAENQVPEFVTYWSERREPSHSWGSKFIKHCLRQWREQQSEANRRDRETLMTSDWRPSPDAVDILVGQAEINANFIDDAIPEFILYWCERGERSSTWNSRFIAHVKRQWARYTSALETDTEPRPLPANWKPQEAVYDVLALANIDRQFAEQQVPEFILFWRDTGRAESSWNTRFLQYVKRQWAYHSPNATNSTTSNSHAKGQRPYSTDSTRTRELTDDLTDRSWAT